MPQTKLPSWPYLRRPVSFLPTLLPVVSPPQREAPVSASGKNEGQGCKGLYFCALLPEGLHHLTLLSTEKGTPLQEFPESFHQNLGSNEEP